MARAITFDFIVFENGTTTGIQVDADINVNIKKPDGTLIENITLTTGVGGDIDFNLTTNAYEVVNYDPDAVAQLPASIDYLIVEWFAKIGGENIEPYPFIEQIPLPQFGVGGLTCQLYGSILDIQGQPIQNVKVRIAPDATPLSVSPHGVGTKEISVLTDANGFFSVSVLRGIAARLIIVEAGVNKSIDIPNQASVNFITL